MRNWTAGEEFLTLLTGLNHTGNDEESSASQGHYIQGIKPVRRCVAFREGVVCICKSRLLGDGEVIFLFTISSRVLILAMSRLFALGSVKWMANSVTN